jgi:SAM-dependent methyltransferase
MTRTEAPAVNPNAEATAAWDGPLYDRFVRFRDVIVGGLSVHGEEALRLLPPPAGGHVLDIGCGFGDTTQRLAALVGPYGSALGVDAAPRFVAAARAEAGEAGVRNARFEVADVQTAEFAERFDYAFSRMGTMFFANPVAALRNVRAALVPGGLLVMVVWRRREDNAWLHRAQLVTERFVTKPEEYDEPTCGPGPFSMSGADTTSDILLAAGYRDVTLRRCDLPLLVGRDIDEAIAVTMDIGPAGEILRLQGDRAAHLHEPIRAALADEFAALLRPAGVVGTASTWIVTARAG